MAVATRERVPAGTAAEAVVAVAPGDGVVATTTVHRVGSGAAVARVVPAHGRGEAEAVEEDLVVSLATANGVARQAARGEVVARAEVEVDRDVDQRGRHSRLVSACTAGVQKVVAIAGI